jgi:hypothetical protein
MANDPADIGHTPVDVILFYERLTKGDQWNFRSPLSYLYLLVKSTEGIYSGITRKAQKQGNTEAVPVWEKEIVVAPSPNYSIALFFIICQYLRNHVLYLF